MSWWMLGPLTVINAPIVFAFTYRVLPGARRPSTQKTRVIASPPQAPARMNRSPGNTASA
jgi:hypothetical protein